MLIRGTVRDSGGHLVAGAVVVIAEAPVDVPDIAALTGDDGTFVVSAPARGRYLVGVRAFDRGESELVVDVDGDVDVEVELNHRGPTPPDVARHEDR